MKVLSLFSGVGGFDMGLERAGMQTVFQCEWDKHATKILERHWPHVPRWDDVSTLTGEHILRHAPVIDVVAWGSPCQDLSVAGKRAGLEGARSGLFHQGVRIIKELRELTNGKYPRISVWENVAGALSSGKGADFGQVLTEMDEAGACFSEWRILDAQYFGVPQRRRRVFLVSVFDPATAARCPDPLLPFSQSLRRDTQESATTGQELASKTPASSGSRRAIIGSDIVGSLAASDYKFPQQQQVNENKCVVVEAFTKGKRAQTPTDDETWDEGRPAPTLKQFDQGDTRATTIVAFASNQRAEVRDLEDRAVALSAEPGTNQQTYVAFGIEEPILLDGRRIDDVRVYDPPVQTLQARMGTGGNNVPVIGFSHTQGLSAQPSEAAWPTLRTEGNGMAVAYPIQDGREIEKHQNGIGVADEGSPAYTLDQTGAQAVAYSIREDAKANTFSATELDRANALSALRPSPQSHHAQMFIAEGTQSEVAVLMRQREGKDGGGKGPLLSEDKSLSLLSSNEQTLFQPHAIAFQPGTMIRMSGGVWDELAPSLRAEAKRGDNEPHVIQYDGYNPKIHVDEPSVTLRIGRDSSDFVAQPVEIAETVMPTLLAGMSHLTGTTQDGYIKTIHSMQPMMAVRRLTPLECERLMGWPDDWTAGQSDTHRYKQCGNGVASPVATWIGQQLLAIDQ